MSNKGIVVRAPGGHPVIPGAEAAGVVDALGAGVDLRDAADAHRALASRRTVGATVLIT